MPTATRHMHIVWTLWLTLALATSIPVFLLSILLAQVNLTIINLISIVGLLWIVGDIWALLLTKPPSSLFSVNTVNVTKDNFK